MSSCIEGEEEVWVNPDASGRAKLELTAPTRLFAQFGGVDKLMADARAGAEASPNIELQELTAERELSSTTLSIDLTFADLRQVGGFLESFRDPAKADTPSAPEIIIGALDLDLAFPDYSFKREIDLAPLLAKQSISPLALNLIGEDAGMSYTIHLPTAVEGSNADSTSDDGKTLHWRYSIPELLEGPAQIHFSGPVPFPTGRLLPIGFALVILTALVLFILKKKSTNNPLPPIKP